MVLSCAGSGVAFAQKSFHQYPYNGSNWSVWGGHRKGNLSKRKWYLERKGRSNSERERVKRKRRKIHGDLRKSPNDRELATDTWLCYYITINNGLLLCQRERKTEIVKKEKKTTENLCNTNKTSETTSVFFFSSRLLLLLAASARLSIHPPCGCFFFLSFFNGTVARLSLLVYCLSAARRGPAEELVSRRRRDNLMDVCWYLDHYGSDCLTLNQQ